MSRSLTPILIGLAITFATFGAVQELVSLEDFTPKMGPYIEPGGGALIDQG